MKKARLDSENSITFADDFEKHKKTKEERTMKFTTLLTIIIIGYVIYYTYQVCHDLFFSKGGLVSDDLRIEEEVDITDEVGKYQPVQVSRETVPLNNPSGSMAISRNFESDGLTQMCGGMSIDELHENLQREHDMPGTTALKNVMKLYE